jgi:hypothetical protein
MKRGIGESESRGKKENIICVILRFPDSPFLCFLGSPFLRFRVYPVLVFLALTYDL